MVKQVLEIEVPDGKKAVWKDGRVVFEDIDTMERIKTVNDAAQYLSDKGICKDILASLFRLSEESFEWKVAAYRVVVAAMTYNEQRYLTTGVYWYPSIEFCRPGNFKNCMGDTVIGRIKSEGEEFDVVGGCAYKSCSTGIGDFDSFKDVSDIFTRLGFQSVNSKKKALYISRQFGKLLFEISYGGTNCDWKWIE